MPAAENVPTTDTGPAGSAIADAYSHCEQITRAQARNFAWGIRLLDGDRRRALSAVYAFARRVDDIGDGDLSPDRKRAELNRCREALASTGAHTGDPVLIALADAGRRFPIPLAAFSELIEGCEADVNGVVYETFDQLEHYCRCVAGSIGRLCFGVFGTNDESPESRAVGEKLADALGIALQLTNILRDVREDRLAGRIYLPAEDLDRFGVTLALSADGTITDPDRPLAGLVHYAAGRAERWYDTGMELLPLLDPRSRACAGTMATIYRRLLTRICADPVTALHTRASLPTWEKVLIAARSLSPWPGFSRGGTQFSRGDVQ